MAIVQQSLFAWQAMESSPEILRFRLVPLDPSVHDTIYVSPTGEVCCKTHPFSPGPMPRPGRPQAWPDHTAPSPEARFRECLARRLESS